jgi:hypothetical protein
VSRDARRREIEVLRFLMRSGELEGVIGREAGDKLQRLPSSTMAIQPLGQPSIPATYVMRSL